MCNYLVNKYETIIIGAGAAGLMTAASLSKSRSRTSTFSSVCVLEKNSVVGKKLSISGGGRCNITNDIPDPKAFLKHYPDSKQFLYSAFDQFARVDTEKFFTENGLPLVTQARNRMFPITERSPDVTKTLEDVCIQNKISIQTYTLVKKIKKLGDPTTQFKWEIHTNRGIFNCENLVLSTGGYAAPETGSTGDGFHWLRDLGHTVSEPSPNIVPLKTSASWVHDIAGVSIDYLKYRLYVTDRSQSEPKEIQKLNKTGRLLFTHFGISGPMVLNNSHTASELLSWYGDVTCSLDLFPDNDHGQLDKKILKLLDANPRKQLVNILTELLPRQLVVAILGQLKIEVGAGLRDSKNPSLPATALVSGIVTKEQRKSLVNLLKDLRFPITGTMGFDRAVIADGGVQLDEIDFKTMQSKLHNNLYIIGDLLDINRPSGGFSLQLCWTTGFVAARAIFDRST